MYAIVEMGGKQHRVTTGDKLKVELVQGEVGSTIEIEKVLMIGGDKVLVGKPYVDGARVVAEIVAHGRLPKVVIHKHIRRKNYQRTRGHHQQYSELLVKAINL